LRYFINDFEPGCMGDHFGVKRFLFQA